VDAVLGAIVATSFGIVERGGGLCLLVKGGGMDFASTQLVDDQTAAERSTGPPH